MANPEQALWRAVITQAIADASGKTNCTSFERRVALDWLFKPDGNFNSVCALADLDPDYTRKLARQHIEKHAHKAAAKSAGKPSRTTRLGKGQLYEFGGKTLTIKEWANEIGCTYATLYHRVANGWSIDRALSTPFANRNTTQCQPAP